MLKNIKNTAFMMLLGLGLMASQTTFAADDLSDNGTALSSETSLPTNYRSGRSKINDLIDQDPLKNFVFQAWNGARAQHNKCGCDDCYNYRKEAKELWGHIRDANTSTLKVTLLIHNFVNSAEQMLSPEMKQWISKQGFNIISPQNFDYNKFHAQVTYEYKHLDPSLDLYIVTDSRGLPFIIKCLKEKVFKKSKTQNIQNSSSQDMKKDSN